MNIKEIENPNFLKNLSNEELNELANEIRIFLLENISKTGGHLSSNLGVVELTIALHYVFDFLNDKIIFDVGHQSYVHKILTGRAKDFPTLRKFNGISGFQKRKESAYDCFEAGHSSTSLSAGLGMAVARDLKKETYDVVPVIGDGALLSGMAFEALNQIGYEKRKMIIIFNDNNMSINHNVGAVTKSFANLRNSDQYNEFKTDVKDFLKTKKFGNAMIHTLKGLKDTVKNTFVDAHIFKEFNLEYYGPVDGHNIKELIKVLELAKLEDVPCVVHVVTKKGKGYPYTEADLAGAWHGVGPFDITTGKSLTRTPKGYKNYSKIIADTVDRIMDDNEKVVAITPAMMSGSALENVFAHHPDRSFDCGIAEEHAVTFAAGLAAEGMHPFVSIYSSFLQRAYDQMNHDICRMDLPVVFGIDRSGLVGEDGETHHGVFDIGFLKALPNLILAQGKDAQELEDLVYTAFKQKHPMAIRYPRGNAPCEQRQEFNEIEIGKWEVLLNNKEEAYILSYGPDCVALKDFIVRNDLPYTLINCRFIKPFDKAMLNQIIESKKPVFIYESDQSISGFGESVCSYFAKHQAQNKVKVMGIPDQYVTHGSVLQLKESLHIDINSFFKLVEKDLHD